MKMDLHNRLVISGFVVSYVAVMGLLVTLAADRLGSFRPILQTYVLMPIGVVGLVLIGVGKLTPFNPRIGDGAEGG